MTDIRMATLRARLMANDPWSGADVQEWFKKSTLWWKQEDVLAVVDKLAAEIESKASDTDLSDIVARQAGRHQHGAKGPGETVSALAFQIAISDIDRLLILAENRKAELDAHIAAWEAWQRLDGSGDLAFTGPPVNVPVFDRPRGGKR